ncbi:MAG: AAA family ATPase, partial [Proteobacteria bacterium]|nr:AAA family ATPase [Pseudomonadota bacterium]
MNGDNRAKTDNTPKVEISVRNFGPIAEADLDLRPLTVFVGPSNTGKTYLSVLIYALHRIFEDFSEFPSLHILPLLAQGLMYDDSAEEELSAVFNILSEKQPLKISHLPGKVRDQLQDSLKDLEIYGSDLEKELKRCFDLASVSGLMRSSETQNDETIVSLVASDVNQDLWHFKAEASEAGVVIEGEINEKAVISPQDPSSYSMKIDHKGTFALTHESHGSIGKPYYLPAARSGIMQSHRVIASSLVARSTRAGLEPFPEV